MGSKGVSLFGNSRFEENTGCIVWTGARLPTGYGIKNHAGQDVYVHRLAAHLWLGMDLDDPREVCHRCDNPPCFNTAHLFMGTRQDNVNDAMSKGRIPSGERKSQAKLTNSKVIEILRLHRSGMAQHRIGRIFGICQTHVSDLVNHRKWKHLTEQT